MTCYRRSLAPGPAAIVCVSLLALGLTACAAGRRTPADARAPQVRLEPPDPVQRRGPIDGQAGATAPRIPVLPAALQPLDSHIPILWVNEQLTSVLAALNGPPLHIYWSIPPGPGYQVYLRIGTAPFSPCPPSGTLPDGGDALLAVSDGFSHPLRMRHGTGPGVVGGVPSGGQVFWTVTEPAVPARLYYVQGCVVDRLVGYTGEATNTVVVELIQALPDLYVKRVSMLTGSELGRLWIAVDDRNWREAPMVRGDTIDWALSLTSVTSPPTGPIRRDDSGTATLARGGWSWILSNERVPDDGRYYDVTLTINGTRACLKPTTATM